MAKVGAIILGATGFGAAELLRLCVNHPEVEIVQLVSSSQAGERVGRVHPHLDGFYELELSSKPNLELLRNFDVKLVISALPHGNSAEALASIIQSAPFELNIIDLSGDFRLQDISLHQQYYPQSQFHQQLRSKFVYGLPELNRQKIEMAKWVANPGCLATATILALAPLVSSNLIKRASVTASTGSSGAGRGLKESVHHAFRHSNLFAYKALSHQHEPEILSALTGLESLAFVAQSAPLSRGITVVASAQIRKSAEVKNIPAVFAQFYHESPFVRVKSSSPEVQNIVGSNFCDIAITVRDDEVVILAAIDNLVKGMAGQAIQNLNLMAGMDQRTGLWMPALRPI